MNELTAEEGAVPNDSDRCKIDDVVETYGLESQHSEFDNIHGNLVALWKGEGRHDERGYRSLTEWFNKRLLKHVYDEHGRVIIGSRLDNEYEILASDDEIARGELLDDLSQDGIDGERVCDDLASWSTMRRHLVNCLDSEKQRQVAATNWEQESVDIATEQLVEKIQKALSSYESKDRLNGATEAIVTVQIQLSCPECPTRRSLTDALNLGYVCKDHRSTDGDGDG